MQELQCYAAVSFGWQVKMQDWLVRSMNRFAGSEAPDYISSDNADHMSVRQSGAVLWVLSDSLRGDG